MPAHVALLRAVNLAGHNKIGMADLRKLAEELGFTNARTLLQSGNLVFESATRSTAKLEKLLEDEARKRLKLDTPFMVRTGDDLRAAIAANPFPEEAKHDPSHLVLVFLKAEPSAKDVKALQDAIKGREVVRVKGRHAYITYPDGIGNSRLTGALIDKKLATSGTGRNWNTVLKLAAMAEA